LLSTEDRNGQADKAIKLNKDGSTCLSYATTFDNGQMTISAWINPSWPEQSNQRLFASDTSVGPGGWDTVIGVWTRQDGPAVRAMRFWINFPIAGWQPILVNEVNSSGWKLFTVTYDGADMKMFVNGAKVGQILGINEPMPLVNSLIVAIRNETWDNGWQGDLDDLKVYNYGLSDCEVQALYQSYLPPMQPTIVTQPVSQTIEEGQNATFTVAAENPYSCPPDASGLEYQWYKDTVLMGGETNASLEITGATKADEGDYYCQVKITANGETTDSDTVSLAVQMLPQMLIYAPMEDAPDDISVPINAHTVTGTLSYVAGPDGQAVELNKNGSGCLSYDATFDT